MELDLSNINKQSHLSDAKVKHIPLRKVLTIKGIGDPMKTFDNKLSRMYKYLESKNIESPDKPSFGIYYKNRDEVSVKNVVWDACIELDEQTQGTKDFVYKEIPAQTVISTILTGGYDLIGDAVHYLEAVADRNNLKIKWELTEVYIKEGKNSVTELWFPIVEA